MSYSSFQILQFHSVSKGFGPKAVLSDLSFTISRRQRVALIGENGAGKTTLARLAAGLEIPDQGEIQISENCRISYLPQHLDLESKEDLALEEWVLESQGNLAKISARLTELEHQISQNPKKTDLNEWDALHSLFLALDGYTLKDKFQEYLAALGLKDIRLDRTLGSLSGGEAQRAALANLLLQNPDLIILDEPTNHLDRNAVEWIEEFLCRYRGAVLLISHDRAFLNRVASGVFELSSTTHQISYYEGNYDDYLETKKRELLRKSEQYQKQKEEISSLRSYLKKQTFSPKKAGPLKDSNKMAYDKRGERHGNSKRRAIAQAKAELEALEEEKLENPTPKDYTGIVFDSKPLESAYALQLENIKITVAGRDLIQNLSFTLAPGQRIILQGPNGSGKTTLLKRLASYSQPEAGTIEYAKQIRIGYLSQEPEFENPALTILEHLQKRYATPEHELRNRLHQIGLIEGSFIKQKIETLSLGQKRRLQLLELMLSKANVLLLDEPTNHLAPQVIEQLEEALLVFSGAVIAATHDRSFADKIGTGIMFLQV